MAVTVLNLTIDAGMHYYLDTIYTDYQTNLPRDLGGYSALLELRPSEYDPRVLLRLSNDNGRILLGGVDGTIIARFFPEDTLPYTQTPYAWSRAFYDLVITDPSGIKIKLLKGFVEVAGSISI